MRTYMGPTMAEVVYATLADNPSSTTQELAAKCGLKVLQVAKRIAAMRDEGKVLACCKRSDRVTGRWMTPWRLIR